MKQLMKFSANTGYNTGLVVHSHSSRTAMQRGLIFASRDGVYNALLPALPESMVNESNYNGIYAYIVC